MHEIDLIPREHLQWRRLRRWLLRCTWMLAMIVVATAAGRAAIAWCVARERPVVEQFRQAEKLAVAQRAQINALGARKAEVESRLAALGQLQRRPGWEAALHSIDAAYNARVWLDQLVFGAVASDAVNPPATASPSTLPVAAPRQMFEVKGHAVDHTAVTEFMHRLAEQPGVGGVRLLDTALRRYSMADVVDFSVSARLDAPLRERP